MTRHATHTLPALALALLAAPAAASAAGVAEVSVTHPGRGVFAATSGTQNAFKVENRSTGGEAITRVDIDLANGPTLFPDILWDPTDGTPAGDDAGKAYVAGSDTSPGVEVDPSYLTPRDNGYEVLRMDVEGLTPGRVAAFAIDVDPTSIQGTVGQVRAGSISGAEMHGATVRVAFDDGTVRVNDLSLVPDSVTDSSALLRGGPPPAPELARAGGAPAPAAVTEPDQTVTVAGPPGAEGTLVVAEGHLDLTDVPGGGFDIDPFEANNLVAVEEHAFTVGPGCTVDVPVELTSTASADVSGINVITAHLDAPFPGPVSEPIVLQLGSGPPSGPPRTVDAERYCDPPGEPPPDPEPEPEPPVAPAAPAAPTSPAGGAPAPAPATGPGTGATPPAPPAPPSPAELAALVPAPACAPAPARAMPPKLPIRLDAATLRSIQRRAQLAIRWLAAADARLDGGLGRADLCGHSVDAVRLAAGSALARGGPVAPDPAAPDPLRPARRTGSRDTIGLGTRQLLVNQRVAQAAIRRAARLERRLDGGLTGAALVAGAVTPAKLAPGLAVAAAAPASAAPAVVRPVPKRRGARVRLTRGQVAVNARIADAALRRSLAIVWRLERGVPGTAFRPGSIGARELATRS